MKTEIQAVADAFKTVSEDAGYRGRWIQDSDYAAIIRLEYGLQSDHLLQWSQWLEPTKPMAKNDGRV